MYIKSLEVDKKHSEILLLKAQYLLSLSFCMVLVIGLFFDIKCAFLSVFCNDFNFLFHSLLLANHLGLARFVPNYNRWYFCKILFTLCCKPSTYIVQTVVVGSCEIERNHSYRQVLSLSRTATE